jgi:4-amino-4-deoxy-L-arabinose transferase-like glycosyltransferase
MNSTMFRKLDSRGGHYLLLLLVTAALTLPNLGAHSLWDIDEGLNAEAAREMLVRGDWISPTFNSELRTAKPALLYWLQMLSYLALGVNELAARLPSALAAWASVLLTYELARRMFDPHTGLLAGLVLSSSIEFCLLAHAATPDAMLLVCTVLTFYAFWRGAADGGRTWFVPTGIAAGLAVLAKGPVGLLLPAMIIGLFFLWSAQWRRLADWRLAAGGMAFALVALPWYVAVSVATQATFIRDFLGKHNVHRFLQPMQNHSGPLYYHLAGLLVFFAPWCVFLGATLWYALRESRARIPGGTLPPVALRDDSIEPGVTLRRVESYRLLVCWFAAYFVFFSIAATKLPNYVLPLYPALAILTARMLVQWIAGRIQPASWVVAMSGGGLVVVGMLTSLGLLVAAGSLRLPFGEPPHLVGLEHWAWLGVVPVAGAAAALVCYRLDARRGAIASVTAAAVAFVGGMAAGPPVALDAHKAPRALVAAAGLATDDAEARAASFGWFQPTLVFYARREVPKLHDQEAVQAFLAQPRPAYLFAPASLWEQIAPHIRTPYAEVARRYDFLRQTDVVVVRNQVAVVPDRARMRS